MAKELHTIINIAVYLTQNWLQNKCALYPINKSHTAKACNEKSCKNKRCWVFFFQAEDGIRDAQESRGLGDVYKRQSLATVRKTPKKIVGAPLRLYDSQI